MEGCFMGHALSIRLPRTYHDQPRIWFELLETRRLFSTPANLAPVIMLDDANHPVATVQIIDGVLTVTTSNGIDDAMIGSGNAKYHPDQLFVHVNHARSYFSREGITGISVDLGDGDDAFEFYDENGLLNLPTTVNGGAGDDEIGGETDRGFLDVLIQIGDGPFAPVHLIGGEGNDFLGGGIGDTVADGGPGNDTMRGSKSAYGHNGTFTILDAPPPTTPLPQFIDDEQAFPITYFLDDVFLLDPIIGVVPPADDQQPLPIPTLTPNAEPQPESSTGAAALPTPLPSANPAIPQSSLLTSEDSLLGHQADEIW